MVKHELDTRCLRVSSPNVNSVPSFQAYAKLHLYAYCGNIVEESKTQNERHNPNQG